jgi:hypothetical protein
MALPDERAQKAMTRSSSCTHWCWDGWDAGGNHGDSGTICHQGALLLLRVKLLSLSTHLKTLRNDDARWYTCDLKEPKPYKKPSFTLSRHRLDNK